MRPPCDRAAEATLEAAMAWLPGVMWNEAEARQDLVSRQVKGLGRCWAGHSVPGVWAVRGSHLLLSLGEVVHIKGCLLVPVPNIQSFLTSSRPSLPAIRVTGPPTNVQKTNRLGSARDLFVLNLQNLRKIETRHTQTWKPSCLHAVNVHSQGSCGPFPSSNVSGIPCPMYRPRKYPVFWIPPDTSFPPHFSTGYPDTSL